MAKNIIRPVKGTVDFYPDEMALRSWLYATIKAVSESFGYEEYEAPLLEPLELYAAKSGEELVEKQSFVFEDRGGNMVALRPELTPSLARMVAQRQNELVYPLRWWSYGPFWRYERPQRGRTREFFQWNIDLIGVDTPEADAELAAIAARFFERAGLPSTEIVVLVNNRALMEAELERIGSPPEERPAVFNLIDRRDKMSPEKWEADALETGLSGTQFEKLRILMENDDLWKKSPALVRFFAAAESFGVSDYLKFAPYVIRGLAYYTGTVFEARDRGGEFRSILGGGRYDDLVNDVGGDPLPAVGFAMGDKVIVEVLRKFGRLPSAETLRRPPVLVTVFDEASMEASIAFAARLRAEGIRTAVYPEAVRLGNQLRYADRIGARFAAILGPDEQANGQATIKDLRSGDQATILSGEAAGYLNGRMGE
ncbi:MAG TPA: histidine--tRNA ligase [Anaerolineales bacterium]|nr:histidine--tRNA ligase [Anaerolineales bacterium]